MKTSNLKLTLAALAVAVLACASFAPQAQATPISGNITFAGGCQLDTGDVNTATEVMTWLDGGGNLPTVTSRSGSFVGFVGNGASVTFANNWFFNSGPRPTFWTVGGFTFNLTVSSIVSQTGGFLNVAGTGILTGNGFDPTAFNWSFSTQNPPAGTPPPMTFSFSASGQSLPDGGATVALLGLALAGIEGIRRTLKRANS